MPANPGKTHRNVFLSPINKHASAYGCNHKRHWNTNHLPETCRCSENVQGLILVFTDTVKQQTCQPTVRVLFNTREATNLLVFTDDIRVHGESPYSLLLVEGFDGQVCTPITYRHDYTDWIVNKQSSCLSLNKQMTSNICSLSVVKWNWVHLFKNSTEVLHLYLIWVFICHPTRLHLVKKTALYVLPTGHLTLQNIISCEQYRIGLASVLIKPEIWTSLC